MLDYSTSGYLNMYNMLLRSDGRGRTKRVENVNSVISENKAKASTNRCIKSPKPLERPGVESRQRKKNIQRTKHTTKYQEKGLHSLAKHYKNLMIMMIMIIIINIHSVTWPCLYSSKAKQSVPMHVGYFPIFAPCSAATSIKKKQKNTHSIICVCCCSKEKKKIKLARLRYTA